MNSKEKIINDYDKYIKYVLKQMKLGYRYEDLFDVGMIGFVNGLNTYDKNKNFKYSTYLYECIKNEILKYIKYESREKRYAEIISLNAKINEDSELQDFIGYENNYEQNVYIKELLEIIEKRIRKFTKKQKLIFNHLYGLNGYKEMTSKEITEKYGFSKQSIQQIKKKSLNKLKFILYKYQNEERKYDTQD